jgi:hypothetical protein
VHTDLVRCLSCKTYMHHNKSITYALKGNTSRPIIAVGKGEYSLQTLVEDAITLYEMMMPMRNYQKSEIELYCAHHILLCLKYVTVGILRYVFQC